MSCFDTLVVACPKCDEKIEFRSKAGACNLNLYHVWDVPPKIAGDLHEEAEVCPGCGVRVGISTRTKIQVAALITVDEGEDEQGDSGCKSQE